MIDEDLDQMIVDVLTENKGTFFKPYTIGGMIANDGKKRLPTSRTFSEEQKGIVHYVQYRCLRLAKEGKLQSRPIGTSTHRKYAILPETP